MCYKLIFKDAFDIREITKLDLTTTVLYYIASIKKDVRLTGRNHLESVPFSSLFWLYV